MNTIICPSCGKKVEISQALRYELEEQILIKAKKQYEEQLERDKQEIENNAISKVKSNLEMTVRNAQNESAEAKENNRKLQIEQLELTKQLRLLKQKDDEREIDMQKRLLKEREEMHQDITKMITEKVNLEKGDLQKQLDDTKKALEEAQRKAQQTSQQLRGETLELELEKILVSAFPHDEVIPIGKGVFGADILQKVKSPLGNTCGDILWESKRAKSWDKNWISKLKEDMRSSRAHFAVIVTTAFPKDFNGSFDLIDGIIVSSISCAVAVGELLRNNLLNIGRQKAIAANKDTKAEHLYSYATSHEFKQQIEKAVEVYQEQMTQIQRERAAYERLWKQREAQAQRIIGSIANIVGAMQGIIGSNTLQIKGLNILELTDGDSK